MSEEAHLDCGSRCHSDGLEDGAVTGRNVTVTLTQAARFLQRTVFNARYPAPTNNKRYKRKLILNKHTNVSLYVQLPV